ncbi:phosphoribosyl-ATP pyrophosphatase [Clostridium homopropionicum DSM 5847]|uniref:Phosphoribosyl-ATP pyrophosphatase n=1 Tax=Clostridium homopropionicum DSM 5847 TaxID=1121318 RepID=A0A0L6ZAE8_9CLOT|nr:phosphoribosyl-ATP diphosphatase [Clostridium homopropionicum]KOA19950.1 phosphoribosyl-ATP pyrophosphatase [Clostridium homopropionicum DSM 5847]SFG88335.1 phosphoribosyl-ATP pyrophosphatase [Clostridium homopropionicum]
MDNIDVLKELFQVVKDRKENPMEGSYTHYLFEKGLDKILKKVGEESTEVIIAAKNSDKEELVNEICDLTYHVLVLMAEQGIELEIVRNELEKRREKIGNKKQERREVENL